MSNDNIPFQVQSIIDGMLNSRDNVHLRGNYRIRLATIQAAIEKALKTYDQELALASMRKKKDNV
jgi:hypothetical protein